MIPDRLHSATIREGLYLARYEAGLRRDVLKLLRALASELAQDVTGAGLNTPRTDWQRARLAKLIDAAEKKISQVYGQVETLTTDELSGLVEVSANRIITACNQAIGANLLQPMAWTDAQIAAVVGDTLIEGAPSAAWWGRQAQGLSSSFADQMRMGMLRGESMGDLVKRAKRMDGIASANAERLVRTSVISTANSAQMAAFEANSDIMDGVEWTAALDSRTCVSCGAMDGKRWKLGEKHATPSLHWNCRCSLTGVTKSWEELAREAHGSTRLARELDKIDPGDRSSMGGYVSGDTDFQGWLKDQSVTVQKDILGEKKWEIWNRSGMSLNQLVDGTGRELTLKELAGK